MEKIIAKLDSIAEIHEINAPLHYKEGNRKQAKSCREDAKKIRAAIALLNS